MLQARLLLNLLLAAALFFFSPCCVLATVYENMGTTWTIYDNDYSVSSSNAGLRMVQIGSASASHLAVSIKYKGVEFNPSDYRSLFPDTFDMYAHVHSDPCESNNGTHWKADARITTPVESNELWFKFKPDDAPYFARSLTPGSHAVPDKYDANIRTLTIHEPKIGSVAAKIACITLREDKSSTRAPTTMVDDGKNNTAAGSPTAFTVIVTFIVLGGIAMLYFF